MGSFPLQLSMDGKIRTKEKCPKCGGAFSGEPLSCTGCLTHPRKYYIVLYAKHYGTIKLYSDQRGEPLASWGKAERVLTGIRNELDQNKFDPTRYAKKDLQSFLFESQIDKWYQDKLAEVITGNRAQGYADLLEYFIRAFYKPHFTGMDVRDIRGYHIQEFYRTMPDKNKKPGRDKKTKKLKNKKIGLKHRKNIMDALRAFFNSMERLEVIESAPAFPVITLDRKAPKWIDYETQLEALKIVPPEHLPIIRFLALQGTRPGEARALRVKDLNLKSGLVTICRTFSGDELRERVKGKVVRPRLINPALLEMLAEVCAGKHPEAFVFTMKGHPYTKAQLWHIWKAVCKKTGLDVTLYQATRHSVASIAVSEGAPVMAIKDVLGHTDIRTTMVYAHANLDSQKAVFRKQTKVLDLVPRQCPKAEDEKEKIS